MSKNSEAWFDKNNKLSVKLSKDINKNIDVLETLFKDCGDVAKKSFYLNRNGAGVHIFICYIDGLTNNGMIEDTIIKPLSYEWAGANEYDIFDSIMYQEAQTVDISCEISFDKVVEHILKGDTAILVDGYEKVLVVSSKRLPLRGISENQNEGGLRGPRDSFNEGIRHSTALIRRRIRDSKLKLKQGTIGQRSRTDYAVIYLEDVANPDLVNDIEDRLKQYEIDAVFDSGMGEHLLEDKGFSIFPKFQSTSRPDKVAAGIVEGRVAVVFDNSPEVIIAPTNLNMMLQASDDYYNSWAVATFARVIRYFAVFISIALPGLYVAITTFHSEMLPNRLLFAIVSARSMVTFPVLVEVLIMELFFELLREAGIRLPGALGNTIGVVGGLIVGQAAVDAGIVSTMVVIVVALTAIASFTIPNEEFASSFRLLKFFVIILSAVFGLYGFILSIIILGVHLSGITSFGIPYLYPVVSGEKKDVNNKQDFVFRAPIKRMIKRPIWARENNRIRLVRNDDETSK